MERIKETLEYFNEKTNEVVKRKSHFIPIEGYFGSVENFFEGCVQGFLAKRKKGRSLMDSVEREKINNHKSVITILPCLAIEYAQRWTYELYV